MLNPSKLTELIHNMLLPEKIDMLHGDGFFQTKGINRLGIPPLVMSDGPMGVRQEFPKNSWIPMDLTNDYATYFPSNTALAATWNPNLGYSFGQAIGSEARSRGKDILLAPGINIIRSPLCGRNFEYMSEDPFLITQMAVPIIKGIQENDVAACVKHFALNNQETKRLSINVEADERCLEEIYFPGFKASIEEGNTYSIMAAYNKFRGDYCCESSYLIQDILRKKYDYDGVIISDWSASHSTQKAALAGLDIEMRVDSDFENYYFATPLYDQVKKGIIDETLINEKVFRILNLMNKLNMLEGTRHNGERNTPKHHLCALMAAEESTVLLKNKDYFLPLKKDQIGSIAVIGENANKLHADGGGSAHIKALYEISPLAGIEMYLGGNHKVTFVNGYTSDPKANEDTYYNLREAAIRVASSHDVVIFIGGLNHNFDTEGKDLTSIELPYEQDTLIKALYEVNQNLVIINLSGTAVNLTTASTHSKALLQTWYNGMESGRALANILFGKVSPSGKLPFTLGKNLEDYAPHSIGEFPGDTTINYKESIFVGYRHFDTHHISPLYPFGHGLSYSTFEFSDLTLTKDKDLVNVHVRIKNTGNFPAKEVVQLYIHPTHSSEPRPLRELKGFKKVSLDPHESLLLQFQLSKASFSYYSEKQKYWLVESGTFTVLIGSSSQDLPLKESIYISSDESTIVHESL